MPGLDKYRSQQPWDANRSASPDKIIVTCVAIIIFTYGAWAEPNYGGRLRVVNEGEAYGFDVIKARAFSGTAQMAGNLVMERLFELGPDNGLIPVLGLSAVPSDDRKIWTVNLRRDVTFHDGTPFDADAVVAHWERILNPENRFKGLMLLRPLKSVEKTGEYEVRFVLDHAWAAFPATALAAKRSLAALIPSPKAVTDDTQMRSPVGTGPFVFKEWKTGDRIAVAGNPDYRMKGKPYLDEIIIRNIPDHDTRYLALISGQVDMIATDRPNHVRKLKANPEFSTITTDTGGTAILMMKMLPEFADR